MRERDVLYHITFEDGVTMPFRAANRASALRLIPARGHVVAVERQPRHDCPPPLALYSVWLVVGDGWSGIKVVAHDAAAAIAAARYALALEYGKVGHMLARVKRVKRLVEGCDGRILAPDMFPPVSFGASAIVSPCVVRDECAV